MSDKVADLRAAVAREEQTLNDWEEAVALAESEVSLRCANP
jgi:hypothetical protein